MKEKKKWLIVLFLIILLVIMMFAIVKCDKSNEYKVTFDANGGTKIESQEVKAGETLEKPEDPERKGYEFIGWYYDGKKFDFDQEITEDMKLEAKWMKIGSNYTVTFDSQGGSDVDDQDVKKGGKAKKPSNPTRSGYTFVEWQLDGKTYDFDSKIEGNITLKAVWTKNVMSQKNDEVPKTNTTTQSIETIPTTPATTPTTGSNAGTTDGSTSGSTGDSTGGTETPTTKKYVVSFYDGNTLLSKQEVEEGKVVTVPTNPSKDKYRFSVWICNNTVCDLTQPVTENLDVYAAWIQIEVDVDTLEELKLALTDTNIETINLVGDITRIDESIAVENTVTINGNGNTLGFNDLEKDASGNASGLVIYADDTTVNDLVITMPGVTGWNSHYAMQVYDATGVVINNYTGTGADAALLVNGSEVTLTGTTTVTGNEFGGIEASKGTDVTSNATLTVNGTVVMTDEAVNRPAMWIENGQATVTATGFTTKLIQEIGKDQTYYYLNAELATIANVDTLEELKAALADTNIKTINITGNITGISETITVGNTVTINGNNNTLGFTNFANASGLVISADNTKVNDLVITMPGVTGWNSHYAMQVYDATGVVINNYTGTGADAALLVNGSEVTLTGTTTVTGNEFGGIEASKGTDVTSNATLTVNGTVVMTDEAVNRPAMWIENGQATVTATGFTTKLIQEIGKDQTYYFLDASLAL